MSVKEKDFNEQDVQEAQEEQRRLRYAVYGDMAQRRTENASERAESDEGAGR